MNLLNTPQQSQIQLQAGIGALACACISFASWCGAAIPATPLWLKVWLGGIGFASGVVGYRINGLSREAAANLRDDAVIAREQRQVLAYRLMQPPRDEVLQLGQAKIEEAQVTPEFYDWNDVIDEAVGFIICGPSGSAKTSVACWLAGHLTQNSPAQVLALDPHANKNPLWNELGITAISSYEAIEEQLDYFLKILSVRRGEAVPGFSYEDDGQPILVFTDELGGCLDNFSQPKTIEKAMRRLGSEGRKYNITFVALNQSKNVGDIGISGAMRNNYVLILLGAAAREHAKNWKDNDPRKQWLKEQAYPCVLSGSIPDAIALHPTHNSYTRFKKRGNPPLNLKPIKQLPLSIPLVLPLAYLQGAANFNKQAYLSGSSY